MAEPNSCFNPFPTTAAGHGRVDSTQEASIKEFGESRISSYGNTRFATCRVLDSRNPVSSDCSGWAYGPWGIASFAGARHETVLPKIFAPWPDLAEVVFYLGGSLPGTRHATN